ncbi:hypothetical protein IQ255_22675 [Pleurocapsales cyanobacterium LEGE 10410]|nr:hypothetical protein [Pleurocapsales cyanobacterium LEGE 10410]
MKNFDDEAQELIKITLTNGMLALICYLIIYATVNKLIASRKIKAIVLGIITPFFFYYSVGHLIYPFTMLLYILKIDSIGLVGGVIFGLLKPLSLLSGIFVALYSIKK